MDFHTKYPLPHFLDYAEFGEQVEILTLISSYYYIFGYSLAMVWYNDDAVQ